VKQRETSKFVLACVLGFCGAFALAVLVGWFMGKEDATGLMAAICAPAGTALGYYYWKAKNENLSKYGGKSSDNEYEE
jgi:uncharacterized membrane protein YeaQ/YmgE (transglycosylase-associated protein family)